MNLGKTISGRDGAPMSSPGLGVLVLSIVSSKKKETEINMPVLQIGIE